MIKEIRKITIIVMTMALVACGKSSTASANPELAGKYELVRIDGGNVDEGISEEEVSRLKEYGLTCELILNEDGTAALNDYGEEEIYTWSGNTLIIPEAEEKISFTETDSIITIKDEETAQSLIFEKVSEEKIQQED